MLCIAESVSGQGEITIRRPFLDLEVQFLQKRWRHTFPQILSNDRVIPSAIANRPSRPMEVSLDLFLLDVAGLGLSDYFTDVSRSADLYIPPSRYYTSVFEVLRMQLTTVEGTEDTYVEFFPKLCLPG